MSISELMQDHHRHCDEAFVAAEEAVRAERWSVAGLLVANLHGDLEAHFAAEEEVLFPAFERATGMHQGPTQVMRFEHDQMRSLIANLVTTTAAGDGDEFAGTAETLLVLMQQHNAKEEHILYPMCDSALGGSGDLERALRERLATGASAT